MTTLEGKYQAIDFDAALTKVGGDLALLTELAELFRAERPSMLSALQRAVADGNGPSARAAAHSLKGSVAVFSAKQATALAVRLEESARAGQIESLPGILTELEAEVERVCAELLRLTGAAATPNGELHPARDGKETS